MNSLPSLLYISGTGRSGTTILEILLGANPTMAGVGELTHIFEDGFLANEPCSCGAAAHDCVVWGDVIARCAWSRREVAGIMSLVRRLEHHRFFPVIATGRGPRDAVSEYLDVHRRLLTILHDVTGASTLIDSSQYAARALLLAGGLGDDVQVLTLTRRPSGIMASFGKPNPDEQRPKTVVGTLAYYCYVMSCLRVVRGILGHSVHQVTFEKLKANPVRTLEEIGRWAELDVSQVAGQLERGELIDVGHIVTGNRLRKAGQVRFDARPDVVHRRGWAGQAAVFAMDAYRRMLGFQ